ncbi:Transcriptional repressor NF-X1 [Cichlidogyrus casuarinus]|uniref:Transcriptional repressor NF-X1 n=1 Tax=Cichlidogyrus casuarinus TaxID=1844966 RepID=A0ABD2QEF6_9PLAT
MLERVFSCHKVCGQPLECQKHFCFKRCHPGACGRCKRRVQFCLMCPCGKVALSKLVASGDVYGDRKECTDPIPTCLNKCQRRNAACDHECQYDCHDGPCPPCPLKMVITCNCGRSKRSVSCQEYAQVVDANEPFNCDRICKKLKICGRHFCKEKCCTVEVHICESICNKKLACGQHFCEESCHIGPCGTCWRGVVYDQIACHCGKTILEPPQPCGTKPPECEHPCQRPQICFHPVRHNCHSEEQCPPCTVLMFKPCPGGHQMVHNIPCFQDAPSCGRTCGERMSSKCKHLCQQRCHLPPCLPKGAQCSEPCQEPIPECGHPCGLKCHPGISCKEVRERSSSHECCVLVELVCPCGVRKQNKKCHLVQNMPEIFEKEVKNLSLAPSEQDFSHLPKYLQGSGNVLITCNLKCQSAAKLKEASAKREALAEEMWVRGDDSKAIELPPAFPPPDYTDFLKNYASKYLSFAKSIEQQLEDAVVNCRDPSSNGRCFYHFAPMNKHKRRFIHELAEFYSIECHVCDPEPHRYVMIIAISNVSKFPGLSASKSNRLTSVVESEYKNISSCKVKPVQPTQKPKPTTSTSADIHSSRPVTSGISYATMAAQNN